MKTQTQIFAKLGRNFLAVLALPQARWGVIGLWGLLMIWFIYINIIQVVRQPVQLPADTTQDIQLNAAAARAIQTRYQTYFNYTAPNHINALHFLSP